MDAYGFLAFAGSPANGVKADPARESNGYLNASHSLPRTAAAILSFRISSVPS
jgi:hypothetical protein